ncbi:MAG: heme ABC transporter ATP-binding protein [Anaerolineales bacterium]
MLKIDNLSVYYGDRQILHGIQLDVNSGEVVALIGPNGAGKSTLIRAVSGVIPIHAGNIFVNQKNVTMLSTMERARHISVVPQAVSMPPAFTVWETVLLGRTPYLNFLGQTSAKDEAFARQALQQADVLHLIDKRMDEISGGEQQRVLLARTLAQDTPILLMDEPTTHLDLSHQIDLLKLVTKQAREKQLTVLIALHDLNLASMFADRIAIVQKGLLCVAGTPQETLTSEIINSIYQVPVHIVSHPESGAPLIIPGMGE